jgi:hypothetical protein
LEAGHDGNPEGLRIIDQMNWTELGIVLPRETWPKILRGTRLVRLLEIPLGIDPIGQCLR